ncbi:MAG: AEC family transporter [Oscillospiraceae bacterium]|nr:AEC family transporter [Oscillospiraceae bacterium]MBQ4538809.1 AEC family transporter [Oscillospiraceae bacterium]
MQQFYMMVSIQATLFIYMAVGYGMSKGGMLSKQLRSGITDMMIYILLPCMVFESFNQQLTHQQLLEGAGIFVVAFAASALAWIVGIIVWRKYPAKKQQILRYALLISSATFAGLPVINDAYGAAGLFLASIYIIPGRILMWTAGISLFGAKSGGWIKKTMSNPAMIAVFLGMGRMLTGLQLPAFIDKAMSGIGNCTSPFSLIIVGSILADVDLHGIFDKDALMLGFVRMIAVPLMLVAGLKVIGFSELGTAVSVILAAMPAGTTSAILAEKYGADAVLGSKCIFITTVMSLFTVPLLMLIL